MNDLPTLQDINRINESIYVEMPDGGVEVTREGKIYFSLTVDSTMFCNLTANAVLKKLRHGLDYEDAETMYG